MHGDVHPGHGEHAVGVHASVAEVGNNIPPAKAHRVERVARVDVHHDGSAHARHSRGLKAELGVLGVGRELWNVEDVVDEERGDSEGDGFSVAQRGDAHCDDALTLRRVHKDGAAGVARVDADVEMVVRIFPPGDDALADLNVVAAQREAESVRRGELGGGTVVHGEIGKIPEGRSVRAGHLEDREVGLRVDAHDARANRRLPQEREEKQHFLCGIRLHDVEVCVEGARAAREPRRGVH